MALVAFSSALSKLAFLVSPGAILSLETCIRSTGKISQKLSLYCVFTSCTPSVKAMFPLYKTLYLVFNAWKFLLAHLSFFVEQAARKTRNNNSEKYGALLIFNGKTF